MNEERWDRIGADWLVGTLAPANGMEAWREGAQEEAIRISAILHHPSRQHRVDTLVEVGCGVGRLTPHLAPYFRKVIATDTSTVMRGITERAAAHWQNVTVDAGLYPHGDAALVWGNLYDEDWSDAAAVEHLSGLVAQFPVVLVQTSRVVITQSQAPIWVERGDDWMLVSRPDFTETLL